MKTLDTTWIPAFSTAREHYGLTLEIHRKSCKTAVIGLITLVNYPYILTNEHLTGKSIGKTRGDTMPIQCTCRCKACWELQKQLAETTKRMLAELDVHRDRLRKLEGGN